MYFPYLRGRQFELLAVRELVNNSLIGKHVFPIIEPVHLTSTLVKTLEICKSKGHKIGVVMNPQVGNFTNDLRNSSNSILIKKYQDFISSAGEAVIPVYILNDSNMNPFAKLPNFEGKLITVCETSDALQFFTRLSDEERDSIFYNLIPDESRFRRGTRAYNNVVFEDYFHKQDKNADYAKPSVVDEPYTDEYKFYALDGFKGFGDYSIVGKTYNDSGFAPYAVAIQRV